MLLFQASKETEPMPNHKPHMVPGHIAHNQLLHEQAGALLLGVVRAGDSVAQRPFRAEDLIIIATLEIRYCTAGGSKIWHHDHKHGRTAHNACQKKQPATASSPVRNRLHALWLSFSWEFRI